jgi:TIR domain-containing protein
MAGAPAQQEIDEPTSKYFRRRDIADLHFLLGQRGPVGSAMACRKTSNCSRGCDGQATGSALGSLSEQYRLHADLQNKGVRCWFAPHDMSIGAKIIDAIDEAIRLRDKVLLILSEDAIGSEWVEGEVTRALDEERTRNQVVLVPVRVDDAVMQTSEGWARLLRSQRNIGDFTGWKEHDRYQKSFERLMRGLTVKPKEDSVTQSSPLA